MGSSLATNFTQSATSDVLTTHESYDGDPVDRAVISSSVGYAGVAISILLFQTIHEFFSGFFKPPKHIQPFDSNGQATMDYWKWKNLCISWFHALISGSWVLLNMLLYPEFAKDLILFYNYSSYFMVCFSAGYFIYDFVDMWRNNLIFKLWELSVHHIAIDVIMLWNLNICRCIGWNIIALSAEVNSFFLHTRKLMQIHRLSRDSFGYRLNMLLNLLTFLVFRFGSCLCMLIGIYYQRARVSASFYVAIIGCLIVMTGINPVLFYRLLKSDFRAKAPAKLN